MTISSESRKLAGVVAPVSPMPSSMLLIGSSSMVCKDPLKWYQKKVEISVGGKIRQEAENEAKQV